MFNRQQTNTAPSHYNPHSCLTNEQHTSPQPLLNKYTPRSPYAHLPKTNSLSHKNPINTIHSHQSTTNIPSKGPTPPHLRNSVQDEYFPNYPMNNRDKAFKRSNKKKQEQQNRFKKQESNKNSSQDFELLPLDSNSQLKNEQMSVSTQSSKVEKCNQKQVRFGGVIEQNTKNTRFMKKKQKMRSPSILKNSKGSLSCQKSRSCSVASGKQRREKEQHNNQHSTNQVIRQKYKSIVSQLQAQHQGKYRSSKFTSGATYNSHRPKIQSANKYKDEIFPPVYSSLFCLKKGGVKRGTELSWTRLSSLYADCQLVLGRCEDICIYKEEDSYGSQQLAGAMNSMRCNAQLLEKMFEGQGFNPYGIYLVKIYQQHSWKYVIVDDYIPVTSDNRPAFMAVRPSKQGTFDIWPYLLQKAYANYYSSYEALTHGKMLDLLQELTGVSSIKVALKQQNSNKKKLYNKVPIEKEAPIAKISRLMKTGNYLAVGQLSSTQEWSPIVYSIFSRHLSWHNPACQFAVNRITFEQLSQLFTVVHLVAPAQHSHSSFHAIRKPLILPQPPSANLFPLDPYLLRSFKVQHPGQYCLSVRQKDSRFFHFKEGHGDYIWLRVILLQKEYGEIGYRWVGGEYACRKNISFTQNLQVGQYFLLLECQWTALSAHQLTILMSGPQQLALKRQTYNQEERLLQKGSLDLAQRYGQLIQINKFICSYNYLTEKAGLIIQNIVNQRVSGNVSVIRSIRGLKCQSQILPINGQFYQKVQRGGKWWMRLSEQIELDIGQGEHYTVVLKTRKGIDHKFFRTFDFGC